MFCIQELIKKLPAADQPRLVSNGFVCWLVYDQPLSDSFFQSLADLGGWSVAQDDHQCLWFFPNLQLLPGLSQLHNWHRVHSLATTIVVFEASLMIDEHLQQSLRLPPDLASACAPAPRTLAIYIREKLRSQSQNITSVVFKPTQPPQGLGGQWFTLEASDQDTKVQTQHWLWLIRPQKSREDKTFIKGWQNYAQVLQGLFHELKITYLQGEDHSLILKITQVRIMEQLTLRLLALLADNPPWPCQYLALEMGHHAFSPDLPSKIAHLFDPLEFNALYFSLSTIFQMANPQIIPVDSRISLHSSKITDLFQVQWHQDLDHQPGGTLNIFLPATLVTGEHGPCFYCGLSSHGPDVCPSRILEAGNVKVTALSRLAHMDMDNLGEILEQIDQKIKNNTLQNLSTLLSAQNDLGVVVASFFEVKMLGQLRMATMVWRAQGKEWPHGLSQLRAQRDEYLWDALDALRLGQSQRAKEYLDLFRLKSPQNYQGPMLYGFLAMERGELQRADGFWEEAESLTYTGLQRSYVQFLRARLWEIQNNLPRAMDLYGQAYRYSPGLSQARYGQAVCMIKSGQLYTAQAIMRELIDQDPDYFSKILLDPELEPGRSLLLSLLWTMNHELQIQAQDILGSADHLPDLLAQWLPEEHPDYQNFLKRIENLQSYSQINNYVAMACLVRGTIHIRNDIQTRVKKDIQKLSTQRRKIEKRLREIHHQVSWFPFPSLLKGFTKAFKACKQTLGSLTDLDLYRPKKFRQAHQIMAQAQALLTKVEKKLTIIQGIRNAILYLFLFARYFFIYELLALVLSVAVFLGLSYLDWGATTITRHGEQNKFVIFHMLLIVLSFLAAAITAVQTTTRFEKYKNKILGPQKT